MGAGKVGWISTITFGRVNRESWKNAYQQGNLLPSSGDMRENVGKV